jgi:hypothetical protein
MPRLIAALRLGFAEGHDCDSLQAYVTDLIESDPFAAIALLLPLADSSDPAEGVLSIPEWDDGGRKDREMSEVGAAIEWGILLWPAQ